MLPWLGLSRATADCPTYRIIDLGSLRTSAGGTSDAFAVNDANQVVGQSNTDVPAALHAFFWDNAGCTGNCMSDLGTLIGGTDSVAYDINNDMEIAGQSETINQQQLVFRATYWSSPMATPLDLGTLGTDVDDDSGAFGINEHSTIVGWTDTDTTCPNEPAVDLSVAFRMQPTGAMTVLHPDGGYGGSDNYDAVAVAINTPPQPPAYGFLPDIAGIGSPCGASPDFCGVPETTDSQVWEENDETATDLSEPPGFGDGRGEARDVNTADELVGWGTKQGSPCVERALFWASATSTPDNLHELARFPDDSQIPATDDTRAEAMNERGQVVGENRSTDHAYLWMADGGQWTVVDLNDEINSSCVGDSALLEWVLKKGRDINESEVIVGTGVHGNNDRAFLLIPIETCLWDISGEGGVPDGDVGVVDFLALLTAWGPCDPPNGLCMADFDCNLAVGETDYLELVGHWGACSVVCPEGSSASGGGAGPSVAEVEQAVVLCGFPDMEALFEWMNTAADREATAVIDVLSALLLE